MIKRKIKYAVVLAAAALLLGFATGQYVGAGNLIPGSKEDPLVSKSYVDDYFQSRYEDLHSQVESLNSRIKSLEEEIASMSGERSSQTETVRLTIGSRSAHIGDEERVLDTPPVIRNDSTMLPLRFVSEALGVNLGYDHASKVVSFSSSEGEVALTIGKNTASMNGKELSLRTPPEIEDGRTLVPIRFIAETLGCEVHWDPSARTVTVIP